MNFEKIENLNPLEKSAKERLNNPQIPTVFLQRHAEYFRKFPQEGESVEEGVGWLTEKGRKDAKEFYRNLFEEMLKEMDDDLPIDVMVVHSPTKFLDEYGERATESADVLIEAAEEVFAGSKKDIRILTDLGIKVRQGILARKTQDKVETDSVDASDEEMKNHLELRKNIFDENAKVEPSKDKKISISRLRESDIFWPYGSEEIGKGQEEYFNALKNKYGEIDFWGKFYKGEVGELEELRKKVGAESARDIADRVKVFLRGISMYQNLKHAKENPGRKLIVMAVAHSDVLSSLMYQGAHAEDERDWAEFDFNKGIRIDLSDRDSRVIGESGKEYVIKLEK